MIILHLSRNQKKQANTNKMDINELQSAHADTFAQAVAIGAQKQGVEAVKGFQRSRSENNNELSFGRQRI